MAVKNYNAVVAKARAIYGKRLSDADYTELMRRQTVSEVAEYLRSSTHYGKILASVDTAKIHRGHLEDILRKNTFEIYSGLCRFQQLENTEFYRYDIISKEINLIMQCILCLNSGNSDDYISALPAYLIKHSRIDLIKLGKARSFEAMLDVIRHTEYYQVLKDVKPDENGKYDYTKCEVALRKYYIGWVLSTIDKSFSGKTAEDLKDLALTQIDMINIINSYRMKAFFKANNELIASDMLPFYGRISAKTMHEMYNASDGDAYLEMLKRTYYGRRMECESDSLEQDAMRLRYNLTKIKLRVSQSAPLSLYAIHYLFEIEVENLIRIIEGIRYGIPSGSIEKLLIK